MLHSDPKPFWKTIKPTNRNIIFLLDAGGFPVAQSDVASVLNAILSSVFTDEPTVNLHDFPYFVHPLMNCTAFETKGIVKMMYSLKKSFVKGTNGISAKIPNNDIAIAMLSLVFHSRIRAPERLDVLLVTAIRRNRKQRQSEHRKKVSNYYQIELKCGHSGPSTSMWIYKTFFCFM